jgi:hypothetical protein
MKVGADELRAILRAYKQVVDASWRDLHPAMAGRAASWNGASEADLRTELEGYLRESSQSQRSVRVFYKLGSGLTFAGCNEHFARDAGLGVAELVGLDDFSDKIPWAAQAAKYRADDREVVDTRAAKLDILERQTSKSGVVTWVHVGKAPILAASGSAIGILGMYEILDDKTAQRLFLERSRASRPTP